MLLVPWLLVLTVLLLSYLVRTIVKPKNYPPGPRWYPFLGCNNVLHSRTAKAGSQWKVISDLAKEYSTNVLGLKMGSEKVVVVFGDKNIQQVSFDKEFNARPDTFFLRLRSFGKRIGITFVSDPLWSEHRKFAFKNLKNEGYGKQLMYDEIKIAMNNMFKYIDNSNGNPISLTTMISVSVTNILWKFTAGEHLKEVKLKKIIDLMTVRSEAFTMAGGCLNQWPWLRFIAPHWTGYNIIQKMNKELSEIIHESIDAHKNGLVEGSDFIYTFLNEIRQNKPSYTEDQLKGVCLDFLIASTQTTGNSFGFVLLSLIRNPGIQEKIYEEIMTTLGDREYCWTDYGRLVYTMAFLTEVLRYYTVALFSGVRKAVTDVVVDGYTVPKGTTMLVSLGDLHFDPNLWDEPNKFKPERFIDENGKLKSSAHLHPFGLGRRRCPGETLSRPFMVTALVEMVKTYRIECSSGVLPSDKPIVGILAAPRPFTARFLRRK